MPLLDDDATEHGAHSDFAPGSDWSIDLDRALAGLSEPQRHALPLCYGADLSHAEAAQILGWPHDVRRYRPCSRSNPRAAREACVRDLSLAPVVRPGWPRATYRRRRRLQCFLRPLKLKVKRRAIGK
ncbi:MAG: hypothetical protein IV097_10145 [Burkholderiaceae bacterium]|nr:hypothetical protein [Burkholderiaceae bacterium]